MDKRNSFISTRSFTLGANEERTVSITGEFLRCLTSTAAFKVAFDDDAEYVDFRAGIKRKLPALTRFVSVRLKDTSGASNTLALAWGTGDYEDDSFLLSAATSIPTVPTPPAGVAYGPTLSSANIATGGLGADFTFFSVSILSGTVTVNGVAIAAGQSVTFAYGGVKFSNPAINATAGQVAWLGLRLS